MKLASPRIWISLFSLVAVLAIAVIEIDRTTPGPLSAVHARIEDLEGRSGCADCHGGWFSDMTHSCQECHEPIKAQIEDRKGLHGVLDRPLAEGCGACHGEHHGESFSIVNAQSFALAGVPDAAAFDHERIGFAMSGRHLEIGCAECHENAEREVLGESEVRYLGLSQDCAACHEDVHEGRMQVACTSCHGQSTWDELFSLGHEKNLPLVGGHGDVSCRKCHADSDAHALEVVGGGLGTLAARQCTDCHATPHTAAFGNGAAQAASMPLPASCVSCHAAEHTAFAEASLTLTHEQHDLAGFPLVVPHDDVACEACHGLPSEKFAERYPGRSSEACSVCHEDVHGGQFATGRFAKQECTACHEREHFEPHAFTLTKHALTRLPLTGRHLEAQCNDCHEVPEPPRSAGPASSPLGAQRGDSPPSAKHRDSPPGAQRRDAPPGAQHRGPKVPRTFHGTPSRCEECHEDAHGGFFEDLAAEMPAEPRGECARCHLTTGFAEIPPPGFDHGLFTGFPVLGAHEQSECAACHAASAKPDDAGRTFGRVEDQFGPFEGCVTCHRDPHSGQFDVADLPSEVDGRTDCARCHEESSFRSFPHGFDHGLWTGFSLVGVHDASACATCHDPLRTPDDVGRTWARAAGAACADCHIDPHAGQFAVQGDTDCARCHDSEIPDTVAFDHEVHSRFQLGPQHSALECRACHKPQPTGNGVDVIRYRPLGTECIDCHGMNEDVLMRRRRRANG